MGIVLTLSALLAQDTAEDLIRRLGSDAPAERREASEGLIRLCRKDPQALKKVQEARETTEDTDLRYRLAHVLNSLTPQLTMRGTLDGHRGSVPRVTFSKDGKLLASASWDGTVRTWEVSKLSPQREFRYGGGMALCVAFSPDGRLLAAGGQGGRVQVWELSGGREIANFQAHLSRVLAVVFSPDGRRLYTSGADGRVKRFDASGNEERNRRDHRGRVWTLALSPDGRTVLSAGEDGRVTVYSDELEVRSTQTLHGGAPVHAVVFSADGTRIATGGADRALCVWSVDWKAQQKFTPFKDAVTAVAFEPTTGVLVAVSSDGSVRRFDSCGKELEVLSGSTGPLWSVAVAPDSASIAASGEERSIFIWQE